MAYLGNQPVVGDSTNTFKVLDDISTFTLTFDASSSDVVSVANDTLSIGQHRFITGQKVTYSDGGGTAITGLTDGSFYFIIKEDQTTIKLALTASDASNKTAINLTGLGVGSSHTLNVKFDGTNTKFKATHTNGTKSKITRPAQLSLSVNGVIQNPTVDYSIGSDSTIVFSTAPVATDKVFGSFIGEVASVFDLEDNTIDEFTGDGSTTTFNLSKVPPTSRDIMVTLDGVVQYPDTSTTTRAYSAAGSQLTFTTAPDAGVVIQVRHIGFAGASTPLGVTAFYGREGNVVLKSTDNISVNDITAAGNVSIGGTLTYEDVTNVDSVGLITARSGVKVGSGITLSPDGDGFYTGIVTATSFAGDINANNLNVSGIATVGFITSSNAFYTGVVTATTFSGSGASLTSLPAANLTGTLPAIDGSNLTNISGAAHPAWFGSQDTHHQISNLTWTTIINLGNDAINPSVNNGGWDESTGVFTVQSGQAGIYYAFGAYGIDDIQGDDLIRCIISKNGSSNTDSIGETRAQESGSNKIYQVQHSQIVSLAVGDTLRLKGWHDEGTTEYSEPNLCYFGGFRIFAT